MSDLIEINFSLDKKRDVSIRKTQFCSMSKFVDDVCDISGVYEDYPIKRILKLKNGITFNTKGDSKKFYVANFSAQTGYYSIYSEEGLKEKDLVKLYKLLEEAEAPRHDYNEENAMTIEQLEDLRRVDGIVEPVYTQDCFPRTLQKKGVTKECFERANLGNDVYCSASQINMIKEYYKKGQDKDPLNGTENFCAF